MKRFADIAISVLFALALLGPTAVFACEMAHVELPSWATAEDAKYLSGGIKNAKVSPVASLDGFASGKFQEALADEVGNRIPFKARVMLANAALQRSLIACANAPKGYPAYPTYYGSSRLYIPEFDAVTYMPYKRSKETLGYIRDFGEKLSSLAVKYPDKRFVVLLIQGYQEPAANPAYSLMSNPVVPSEYVRVLAEAADGSQNVFVSSQDYGSLDEYYTDFFRTDHHWNHLGIERAYNNIAVWLGLEPFEPQGEVGFGEYRYTGATARFGLDMIAEKVFDTAHDFSDLIVRQPNGSSEAYGHREFENKQDPGKPYAFYDSYYGFLQSGSTVLGSGNRRALVVSNSYGPGIVPYLAENYAAVDLLRQIHPSSHDPSVRLEKLLADDGYDDVIFVANPTDLAKFVKACPDYFSG